MIYLFHFSVGQFGLLLRKEIKHSGPAVRASFLTEHGILLIMDSATIQLREKLLKLVVHDGMYRQTPQNKGRNFRVLFQTSVFTSELEIALSLVTN